MKRFLTAATLLALGWLSFAPLLEAQPTATTARAQVLSTEALGRGDTGAAFSSYGTVFFYNPAHLIHVARTEPTVRMLGSRGDFSASLFDHITFFADDLRPALQQGITTLNAPRQRALYETALLRGSTPGQFNGDVLLPSFVVRHGLIGIGGGLFASSTVSNQYLAHASASPQTLFFARGDLMALGTAAMRLPLAWLGDLSVGITGKATRRYVTTQRQALAELSQDEAFYVLTANNVGLDVGIMYRVNPFFLPGRISLGLAIYDVVHTQAAFRVQHIIRPEAAVATEEAQALAWTTAHQALQRSLRLGGVWHLPELGNLFNNTAFLIDYVDSGHLYLDVAFLDRFHLGAQTTVGQTFSFRLGLRHGRPAYGLGLHLGRAHLDYAYYGFEPLPTVVQWHHSLQLVLFQR